MLLREATSETYGPRVYSHHINLHHFIYLFCFYFLLCIFIPKIPKILSLSDLTLVSDREGIDNPKRWLRVAIVLRRYEGLARDLLLD